MSAYDDLILATSGLVVYWKGEELAPPPPAPNSSLIDSFNGWNGTLQPNSVGGLVQGLVGPILTDSVSYGESGAIARIPSLGAATGALAITGAQSWECWAIWGSAGDAVQMMISANGSEVTNHYLSIGQRSTGNFPGQAYFTLEWPSTARQILSCVVTPDVWHHFVGTYDGVDTMKLYVDSWLVDERSDCPPAPTNTPTWRLGYITNVIFGAVYRSSGLSHTALYNEELTPATIISHVITALGSRPDNPCGETPVLLVGCPNAEGVVGEPYSSEITVSGGTPPYTFSIFSGALPDGLTLDPSTGAITGTPTVADTFNFVVQVIDADFNVGFSSGCQIVISEVPPPSGPPTDTFSFDFGSGTRVAWWIAPQVTDSGDNLRDKAVKSFIPTGRMSNPRFSVYAYGPEASIDADEVEAGTGSTTGKRNLPTTTQVRRYARRQINVPNAMMHTWRLEGITEEGDTTPDRVDEVVTEIASQGIRR